MIALLLAILALLTQPQPVPADFTMAALTRGQPVVSARFVGLEWSCDEETCYAGLLDGSLETGP